MATPTNTPKTKDTEKAQKTPIGDKEINKGRAVEDPELAEQDEDDMSADANEDFDAQMDAEDSDDQDAINSGNGNDKDLNH